MRCSEPGMTPIEYPSWKSLWPLLLVESVLVLVAGSLFYFGASAWLSIPVAWLVFGLFCYLVILRFYPPTPLIDDTIRSSDFSVPPKPFSVRDAPLTPLTILALIPLAVASPLLLAVLLWHRNRGSR
jgi:hypothetical protein